MIYEELVEYMDGKYFSHDAWGKMQTELHLSKKRDLAAFLLLERLCPGPGQIVSAAEHNQIWLGVDLNDLAESATFDDLDYLMKCGVFLDKKFDCLSMFK